MKKYTFPLYTLVVLLFLATTSLAQAQAQVSLYADPKARQVGDLITVILAERTAAQRSSAYDNQSDAHMGGGASVEGEALEGRFGMDAAFSKGARNRNQTSQSDLLQGNFTATVTGVDTAGNLIIAGERKLNVNGVTHLLRISGVARPLDVRSNNTILSYEIANAQIDYRRAGLGRKFIKPGTFVKIGVVGVLGAALLFATQ